MRVSESYIYQERRQDHLERSRPRHAAIRAARRRAGQGRSQRRSLPAACPSAALRDPLGKPNQFKLDFPIKPGESRVDLAWDMPFNSPGVFEDHMLCEGGLIRIVAPPGVEIKGDGLTSLGQEPTSQGAPSTT